MFVYLFRRNGGDRALTSDMTGRNLPDRTPSNHWMFVEALDTDKFVIRQDIAQSIKASGYYIF